LARHLLKAQAQPRNENKTLFEGLMNYVNPLALNQKTIRMACAGDSTVLLLGATGTGKSSLAREIHNRSRRREKPFITVNLATLHEGTLESELFGHERGAFTGADQRRVGKLEIANGGTVFLDEIGDLTPRLQARLLEFLQSRTISPVGANREVRLDVRIIAATHRNLEKKVRDGTFREDLLHRLRVLSVELPGLSQQSECFGEIFHAVLESVCKEQKRTVHRIEPDLATQLEAHPWPGNYRELRNVLEYAVQSAEKETLAISDLPPWFVQSNTSEYLASAMNSALGVAELPLTMDFYETITRFEKEYFRRALTRFGGRLSLTARKTGMNKTTLLRRLRQLGLHPAIEQGEGGAE